jgi:hypothetical protein
MKQFILTIFTTIIYCLSLGQKWDNTYGVSGTEESFSDLMGFYDNGFLISMLPDCCKLSVA